MTLQKSVESDATSPRVRTPVGFILGAVTQGFILALLLHLAISQLLLASGGIRLFRYQGF